MTGLTKLPRQVLTQLGIGAILTIVGVVWMFVIFFIVRPDQIFPTKDGLSEGYEGMRALASTLSDQWSLSTAAELAGNFVVLLLMNLLFVVVRIGWLTSLFFGSFAIFEAISGLKKARR